MLFVCFVCLFVVGCGVDWLVCCCCWIGEEAHLLFLGISITLLQFALVASLLIDENDDAEN